MKGKNCTGLHRGQSPAESAISQPSRLLEGIQRGHRHLVCERAARDQPSFGPVHSRRSGPGPRNMAPSEECYSPEHISTSPGRNSWKRPVLKYGPRSCNACDAGHITSPLCTGGLGPRRIVYVGLSHACKQSRKRVSERLLQIITFSHAWPFAQEMYPE